MFSIERKGIFKTIVPPEEIPCKIGSADLDLCGVKFKPNILKISGTSVLELKRKKEFGMSYNSFLPEIKMTFVRADEKTRIDVSCKLPMPVLAFAIIYVAICIVIQVLFMIFSSHIVPVALGVPAFMAVGAFLLLYLGFKLTCNRVIKDLELVLSKYLVE